VTGTVPERRVFSSIAVGDELTPMVVDVTATVIAAGAIATRDFMPVHHDRDYAQAQGAPDIFMNILSSNAFCSRFLTNWAGPETFVRKLAIRLGVSVHPNSVLTFAGTVSSTSEEGDEGVVDVEFTATNDLGAHVTGTATITLPLD
jgi:hypothetical protein